MAEWRETPGGERQWLGGDGNWYSSEQMAVAAGSMAMPPEAPLPPDPDFPGIYHRPTKKPRAAKRSAWMRPRPLAAIGMLAVVILLIATLGGSSGGPYKVDQIAIEHSGTAKIYVLFRVHNLGTSASTPSCNVSVISPFVSGIGTAILTTRSPIDGNQYGGAEGQVVISGNDAMSMDQSDMTISC